MVSDASMTKNLSF